MSASPALHDCRSAAGAVQASPYLRQVRDAVCPPAATPPAEAGVRPRTRAVAIRHGADGWMSSILARLPMSAAEAGDADAERYLSYLSDALADGRIVGDEARTLAHLAGTAGFGSAQVMALNQRFLESLREAAFDDDILTAAELTQLRCAAKALGVPEYFDDLVVQQSRSATVPRQRRCGSCRAPGHYRSTCPDLASSV